MAPNVPRGLFASRIASAISESLAGDQGRASDRRAKSAASNKMFPGHLVVEPAGVRIPWKSQNKNATATGGVFILASPRGFEPLLPP